GTRVLIGASLLSAVLGSIHAFSIFLEPLETQFQASRGLVSLTYSVGLIFLTLMVLLGHRIYARWAAPMLCLGAVLLGAFGASVAAYANALWQVWLGYSVLFGLANGLGYGFGLQMAAQANPGREGFAMGVVTAAYALGAVVSPALFETGLANGGFRAAMLHLAIVLLFVGLMSAAFMRGTRFATWTPTRPISRISGVWLIWLAYFGGVMAGLMVIGHAAGIARALDPNKTLWIAPAVVAACNLFGSLLGGQAVDRLPARGVVGGFSVITLGALVALVAIGAPVAMVTLGLVGFAYGGTIASWPSVIAKRVGMDQSAKVYGRVFTAWGMAGLAGPWLAGTLYDGTGAYTIALGIAAMFAGLAVVMAARVLG
ncbi:MAG: MFS transporter, partial [Pseudomonadota bacterium]